MNSTDKIPEDFELWMRQQADKISADSPPAIQSHLYAELCVAMEATYRHLSSPTPIEAAEAKIEEKEKFEEWLIRNTTGQLCYGPLKKTLRELYDLFAQQSQK